MIKQGYSYIYFLGIGGIGMSALARYFNAKGLTVAGYDKTVSRLTKELESEGIAVHYEDLGENMKLHVGKKEETLVVLTPAVPADLKELRYLQNNGYTIQKRATVLGMISEDWKTLAVAGTHGKTTTSTLLAHVLSQTSEKCSAFLGGISSNFNSNLIIEPESPWMVVEADEYDRSFHQLKPFSAIITSTEADHLDIYQDAGTMVEAFDIFSHLINKEGKLIRHYLVTVGEDLAQLSYGIGADIEADYKGYNLKVIDGHFSMDVQTPTGFYKEIKLGLPGVHNAENALAVIALVESIGIGLEEIRAALQSFKGVKRRFEIVAKRDNLIFIDDYAHHPTAIHRLIESLRLIYGEATLHVIFQPHLYSRTKDFMSEFAESLKEADEVILMPIYPARELPIEGVTSVALAEMIGPHVKVLEPDEVLQYVAGLTEGIVVTVGAGNIDRLVEPIQELLS